MDGSTFNGKFLRFIYNFTAFTGTVHIISSVLRWNVRFTTVPIKPWVVRFTTVPIQPWNVRFSKVPIYLGMSDSQRYPFTLEYPIHNGTHLPWNVRFTTVPIQPWSELSFKICNLADSRNFRERMKLSEFNTIPFICTTTYLHHCRSDTSLMVT